VEVGVGVRVQVGVRVALRVAVGGIVHVGVPVRVGVHVGSGVRVGISVGVRVGLAVRVGVRVGEFVGDGGTVGVGETTGTSSGISLTRSAAVAHPSSFTSTPWQALSPKIPSTTAGKSSGLRTLSQLASPRRAAPAEVAVANTNSAAGKNSMDASWRSRRLVRGVIITRSARLF